MNFHIMNDPMTPLWFYFFPGLLIKNEKDMVFTRSYANNDCFFNLCWEICKNRYRRFRDLFHDQGNIPKLNKGKSWNVFLQFFLISSKKHVTNTSKRLQHVILLAHVLTFFLLKFFLSLCVMGARNDWHY